MARQSKQMCLFNLKDGKIEKLSKRLAGTDGLSERQQERYDAVKAAALAAGLPELHACALSRAAVRQRLDGRVCRLLEGPHRNDIEEMMTRYSAMNDDPVAFYQDYKGGKVLRTHGTLSLAYTFSSPTAIVKWLLEDARSARAMHKMDIELGYTDSQEGISIDSIVERRFDLRQAAFLQDMRANGVPSGLLDALLMKMHWGEAPDVVSRMGLSEYHAKEVIMTSCYVFFSSDEGKKLAKGWTKETYREDLLNGFIDRFCNDPHLNPYLLHDYFCDPEHAGDMLRQYVAHIGTPEFEQAIENWKSEPIFGASGKSMPRGEYRMSLDELMRLC